MWIEHDFFKYTVAIILLLVTVLLLYYSLPVFYLFIWFLATIFLPILFAVLLYYLLRPIVELLDKWLPKYLAILSVYFLISGALVGLGMLIVPQLSEAISAISSNNFSSLNVHLARVFKEFSSYVPVLNLSSLENLVDENLQKINMIVYQIVVESLRAFTSLSITVALTPFILFYFLRDDFLFSSYVMRFVPRGHQDEVQKIMHDIDRTLTGFVSTQVAIAAIVGSFLSVGYLVIHLPYALALALFAMIFYVIPFLGTFIAVIPALLVAASIDLFMMLKVIIIMCLAHFIEAYLVTPRMMSNALKIHPLTIITLLLVGGSLFGVLGLIVITPAYSVVKVFVWNIYKILKLRSEKARRHVSLKKNESAQGEIG